MIPEEKMRHSKGDFKRVIRLKTKTILGINRARNEHNGCLKSENNEAKHFKL